MSGPFAGGLRVRVLRDFTGRLPIHSPGFFKISLTNTPVLVSVELLMPAGTFIHLDAATLATMKTEWLACLSAIATAHQSYTIGNRTFTRANLKEVSEMVGEITYAQQIQSGGLKRWTYGDMSR